MHLVDENENKKNNKYIKMISRLIVLVAFLELI